MMESCRSFVLSSEVTSDILSKTAGSLEPGHSILPALHSAIISQPAGPDMPQENQDSLIDCPKEMGQSQPQFQQPDREILPASDKNQDSNKNKSPTDFLGGLISRLNTMANDNSSTEEVIRLPRSQLTIIVKQMLVMQTFCNFIQELTDEKSLKQRSLILMDGVNQNKEFSSSRMMPKSTSFLQTQDADSERQVFRFDSSVPDQSKHVNVGTVMLESNTDASKSTFDAGNRVLPFEMDVVLESSTYSGNNAGSFEGHIILGDNNDDRSGQLETDGESVKSMSLQLPSRLYLDGDHPPNDNLPGKDETPRGYTQTATVSSSQEQQFNIPDLDLIEGSQECCEPSQESADSFGDTGVSAEEFELMQDELDKSKRLMHSLLQENEHLKETARKLEEANAQLLDKESKVIAADTDQQHLAEKLKKMEKYVLMKDHAMAALNTKITHLLDENKTLKDQRHVHSLSTKAGPQSQPPSDTGYSALPPIVEPGVCYVSRETQTLQEDEFDVKLCAELESVRAANENLQKQIDLQKHHYTQMRHEVEQKKAMEKQLTSTKDKLLLCEEQLRQTEEHRRQLAAEITVFYDEIDKERRKSVHTEERYRRLLDMMEDERRRFSRDEKELLNRCDQLEEDNNRLKNLVHTLEACLEGSGQRGNVSSEQLNELPQLKSSLNHSVRDSSPGRLVSGSASIRPCWPSPSTTQSRNSPGAGIADGTAGTRPLDTSVSRSTPNLHKNLPQASAYPPHYTQPVWHLSPGDPLPPPQVQRLPARLPQSGNKASGSKSASQASSAPSVALQSDKLGQYKAKDKRGEWVCPFCEIADFESEEKFQKHLQQCSDCHT